MDGYLSNRRIWVNSISGNKMRADTPEKKREVLNAIYEFWCKVPNLRLGQLIVCSHSSKVGDPFYIEDFKLVENIEVFTDGYVNESRRN